MLKPWAKWLLVALWVILLVTTTAFWNPFASLPALLKYSVVSIYGAAVFGGIYIVLMFWVMMAIIFPLPPRADAKARKPFFKSLFPWLFKAPTINPKAPQRLDELVGNEQAKMEIREVIDMIANPQKYEASGADLPKGMLFVGPPGVGKTLFARAIANEVGLPFYVVEGGSISGLIMGLGVIKIKTLFSKLRSHGKAILFIDEIDSIGVRRQQDGGMGGVADMNMTLNTILTEMDGFKSSDILVIGATNNDGILDPALMRAGRMDRRIYFQSPDPAERQSLFSYYLNKVRFDRAVDLDEIAKLTANFSPAEIAGVVNEAALIAQRPGGPGQVTTEVLKQALTRISVGLERTMVQTGLSMATVDGNVRLADVVGIDEVKQDVTEIVEFLKYGDELHKIGAKIPKGLLLIGPPGVGKTMLAKAMANEANVPFYALSASYLKGNYSGEAVGHIRALYSQARKSPAAIVFIDEIDAISGTMSEMGNNRTSALNQLLVELDGFSASNVITIGATNDENSLDPAFTRSGRFDRKAYIGLPDAAGRKILFEKYLKSIKSAGEIDSEKLAKLSMNFSGADIAATANEAAIIAIRKRRQSVEMIDLEEAIDRISITAGAKMNTDGMNFNRVADLEVNLDDVKGIDEAKHEAAEVVALLKNADKIASMGLKAPKGVLLVGPPGTGKTMLAKAIANEAGVPIYFVSGSDFVQKWVGLGAQRVRALYERARRSGKPAIVFIDEIDAIASHRAQEMGGGGTTERNVTLNQLLVELDGFGKHKVLTIGATNHVESLDPALLRPGRMDRHIEMPYPDIDGRVGILEHYLTKVKHVGISVREIARMTVWKTGADLSNIVNEAGLIAIRNGRDSINHIDMINAIQRQSFGMSYSRQVVLDELRVTAYHEAGHAIVAYYRDDRSRIQIVTIVPSGGALGYVWPVDKDQRHKKNRTEILVDIEISLGSIVAERMFFDVNAWGVSQDLKNAAGKARSMVREWGMGPFPFNTNTAFGGSDPSSDGSASPETEREIEVATMAILDEAKTNVEALLKKHRSQVEALAEALLDKETLYYRDVVSILDPQRSDSDIEKELAEMSERKHVGKQTLLTMNGILGLGAGTAPGSTKNNARVNDNDASIVDVSIRDARLE